MRFALLPDVVWRGAFFHEQVLDLIALMSVSGAINAFYLVQRKVVGNVFGWKAVIVMAIGAIIVAVVSAFLARTKAM